MLANLSFLQTMGMTHRKETLDTLDQLPLPSPRLPNTPALWAIAVVDSASSSWYSHSSPMHSFLGSKDLTLSIS